MIIDCLHSARSSVATLCAADSSNRVVPSCDSLGSEKVTLGCRNEHGGISATQCETAADPNCELANSEVVSSILVCYASGVMRRWPRVCDNKDEDLQNIDIDKDCSASGQHQRGHNIT